MHHRYPFRMIHACRMPQYCIHYAEERRVRPDSERQRNPSRDRESRASAQLPQCVTKVLERPAHTETSLEPQRHHETTLAALRAGNVTRKKWQLRSKPAK
jgi:hypothetical protein